MAKSGISIALSVVGLVSLVIFFKMSRAVFKMVTFLATSFFVMVGFSAAGLYLYQNVDSLNFVDIDYIVNLVKSVKF